MSNIDDLARIEYVLNNYDDIGYGGTTEAYTTVKENGRTKLADTVVYSKKINGTYYVVQAVPNTKAKTLFVVSAYINKKGAAQLTDTKNAPVFTSKNGSVVAPTSSIPQKTENVKSSVDGGIPSEYRKSGRVTAQTLERLTQASVQITNEQVKKVTGFGDRGAELVTNNANADGATFYEVVAEVKPSYMAGFQNPDLDIKKVAHTFTSQAQEDAYTAGQKDAIMQNAVAKENAKSATVYDSAFADNEFTKNWSAAEKAAFEAGKLNVPREQVHLATLEQEEAYNNGRIEYIRNMKPKKADSDNGNTVEAETNISPEEAQATTSVSEDVESEIKSDKYVTETSESVTNPTESGIKKADSVTETSESEKNTPEAERYDIPEGSEIVNNIVVDEHSKRLKRENPRAYSNIIRMAKRLRMNVRFVKDLTDENGKALDGLITSKGVFINADAKNPSRFVATHEFGHRMKQAAPKVWAAYQEYVINKLKRESFGNGMTAYDVLYEETKNAYGKDDADSINEEIAVNYAGELFDSEEMLESFIREDKSLALRVRDWWYKVLESMGLLSEKKKAQQLWLRAYTAAGKNVKEGKVGEYNEKRASQMRNAEGETRSEETDEQRRKKGFQKNSLIKKIQSNLEQLSKEDVILSLDTDIFNDRNMNIVEQVGVFFSSLGNKVYRADFGEVILNKDGIKSAIGHKMGRAKCIAFRAVPDIIKYGKQIDYQEKWKGRPYDSYVFAGKVKIGDEDAFVGVVVTRNKNTSEYYLHEIVDNEGNFISIKNDEVIPNKTVSKTDSSLHGGITSSIDTTISQDNLGVNSHSMQNTAENVQEGKKSIPGTRLSELVEKYGAIQSGENPHREVQVPQKTEENKKVSQTVRTILEAKATPDEVVPTIEKMVEDGVFSYDVYTDKKAIENGEEDIKKQGWTQSLTDWSDSVKKGGVSKDITTKGWILYNHAANSGDTEAAITILDAMVKHQRSAAQALQATRILKQLSPETQLYGVQKSVSALQQELSDKYGKKAPDLKINEELAEKFLKAKTEEERIEIEKEIYRDIGRQMPSRFMDKWNAWRYVSMLSALKTHLKNTLGSGNHLLRSFTTTANIKSSDNIGMVGELLTARCTY